MSSSASTPPQALPLVAQLLPREFRARLAASHANPPAFCSLVWPLVRGPIGGSLSSRAGLVALRIRHGACGSSPLTEYQTSATRMHGSTTYPNSFADRA